MTEDQERQLRALIPVALHVSQEYGETLAQATERILRMLHSVLG